MMEVKLKSAPKVENFQTVLRSVASLRRLNIVTRQEYNTVPRTVLEVFSPYLAALLSSLNSPEETPTIIFPEIKSETLKHLVDLLQHGAIQVNRPAERKRETIGEVVELANLLNIEMNNLAFDEEDSVPVGKTDLSDELLLFEEDLFCQQLLKKEYVETEQTTCSNMVKQVKQENTEEYFENMTIDDHQIKKEEYETEDVRMAEDEELEDTEAVREEGELSEEEEVFTLHCRRCRFVCCSRKELERHRDWYHREERRESRSPANKRSRYSTSSYQRYSSSEGSPFKQMKYQHRYKNKTQEFRTTRTRFHK